MPRQFLLAALLFSFFLTSASSSKSPPPIKLFNGKDLTGWHTWTARTKFENPGIFLVENGCLRINGGDGKRAFYGGIITNDAYANYRIAFDYKFIGPTHGERKNNARDSGILLHCVGSPEGANWPPSI